jgi:hypothetical protein
MIEAYARALPPAKVLLYVSYMSYVCVCVCVCARARVCVCEDVEFANQFNDSMNISTKRRRVEDV